MTNQYQKESPESIQKLFNTIAPRYDLANSLMSFNMHTLWNNRLAKELVEKSEGVNFLDICAGTGDIAWRIAKLHVKEKQNFPELHLLDFSSKMLEIAKKFAATLPSNFQKKISFYVENAEELPFDDEQFDAISVAYGIRNVQNVEKCFRSVHRVLKPGAWFAILELTRPQNSILRFFHKAYLATAIPLIGKLFCANKDAYTYLSNSIHTFVSPQDLGQKLLLTGFETIEIHSLCFGTATLILAKKR